MHPSTSCHDAGATRASARLCAGLNLNGHVGVVEEAGAERATVRLDSGLTVSAMLENITSGSGRLLALLCLSAFMHRPDLRVNLPAVLYSLLS